MSNGQHCCAIRYCCPAATTDESKVVQAVLDEFEHGGGSKEFPGNLVSAEWLLQNFDLVPKGVGVAIAEAYRPLAGLAKG